MTHIRKCYIIYTDVKRTNDLQERFIRLLTDTGQGYIAAGNIKTRGKNMNKALLVDFGTGKAYLVDGKAAVGRRSGSDIVLTDETVS